MADSQLPTVTDLIRLPIRALAALAARAGLRLVEFAGDEDLSSIERAVEVSTGRAARLRDAEWVRKRTDAPARPRVRGALESIGTTADRAVAKFGPRDERLKRHAETAELCAQALQAAIDVCSETDERREAVNAVCDDYRRLLVLCGGRAGDDFPPIEACDWTAWPLWPNSREETSLG